MSPRDSERRILSFLRIARQLKDVPRTGWLDRGIPREASESVADHTWFVALAAWVLALDDPRLDAQRVLQLAMIHDLAEAVVGDTPPYVPEDIPDPEDREAFVRFFAQRRVATAEQQTAKAACETSAMNQLLALLPDISRGRVLELWQEYEARETPEARFVKDLDRFDAFLQARHYASLHPAVPVEGFTDMARQALESPALCTLRDEVLASGLPTGNPAIDLDLRGDNDGSVAGET